MPLVAQKRFTDREEPRRFFLDKLKMPQADDEFRIITFYGIGGQGKSALSDYFQDRREDQEGRTFSQWAKQYGELPNYKIASVNFKENILQTSSAAALVGLRNGFVGTGIDFFRFDLAFGFYLGKSLTNPGLEQEFPGLAAKDHGFLFDLISLGSLIVPPAGAAISVFTTLGRHADKLKPKNRAWYFQEGQKLAYELETLDQQTLEDRLPRYLGQDLTHALKKLDTPRLVIMMDTHEALWGKNVSSIELGTQHIDGWIRELVSACPGIFFTILGRDYLKWDAYSKPRARRNYTAMLKDNQHLLGGLSDQDAHLFLRQAGVWQEPIRKVVVKAADGLPLYLDLQVETYNNILEDGDDPEPGDFGGTLQEVINRFLWHLSDQHKDALLVLGQARQLSEPVFELLKQRFFTGSPVHFDHLVGHSFVQELSQPGQYSLHQLMQEYLHNYVKQEALNRFESIHQYLFEYYDERATVEDIKAVTLTQEAALVEAAYHKEQTDLDGFSNWFYKRQQPFNDAGRYQLLIPLHERNVEFGEQHPSYAVRLNNLANLLRSMGRYEEAELLYRQAIEIDKQTIGEQHPSYAVHLNNLAGLLESMGRYEEAEPLYRQATEIGKQTIGEQHPSYAVHLDNLANLLRSMGRYEEAEPLYRQAIEIDKQTIGEQHPRYAVHLNNLANLLRSMGRYEEAEPLYRQAIEIGKQTIGERHPSYAVHLDNLAGLLGSMGRYEEAELLYRQATEIDKQTIGEQHPSYAVHLDNLANLLRSMGRYEEAEPLYRQAIEIGKQTIGERHSSYAVRLNNLAGLLGSMGRYKEAEPLYLQAIDICQSLLGENHPHTKTVLGNYQEMIEARG